MITLEINGTAIAVIDLDEARARDFVDDEDFQEDLRSMTSGGEPIWNGTDALTLRPSTEAETRTGQAGATSQDESADEGAGSDAGADGDADSGGEVVVVFLVAVDDEDDDEEDEGMEEPARASAG